MTFTPQCYFQVSHCIPIRLSDPQGCCLRNFMKRSVYILILSSICPGANLSLCLQSHPRYLYRGIKNQIILPSFHPSPFHPFFHPPNQPSRLVSYKLQMNNDRVSGVRWCHFRSQLADLLTCCCVFCC